MYLRCVKLENTYVSAPPQAQRVVVATYNSSSCLVFELEFDFLTILINPTK